MSSFSEESEQAVRDAAQMLIGEKGLVDEWVLTFTWVDPEGDVHTRSCAKGSSVALVGMTQFAREIAMNEMFSDLEDIDDD